MVRTPIKERRLPDYTVGEEEANMISHIVGGGIGIIVTVFAVLISAFHGNVWGIVSGAVYGFTMIALFSVSSIYHGLKPETPKKIFRIIDHCTIYFLIAGTYTPILLSALRPKYPGWAWAVFGVEWGLALIGAALNAIDLKAFRHISMAGYIGMGWCIVLLLGKTVEVLSPQGFGWLFAGGISYTVGAVLYVIGIKRRYFHTVFHVFVDMGCILQAVAILFYAL